MFIIINIFKNIRIFHYETFILTKIKKIADEKYPGTENYHFGSLITCIKYCKDRAIC